MKKINFKKWRFARWVALVMLVATIVGLIIGDYGLALSSSSPGIVWLLLDVEQGRFARTYDALSERWEKHCKELNNTWYEYSLKLEKENNELKEQMERLKSIYHINTNIEENYNYETE